jgi:hypothetical protein
MRSAAGAVFLDGDGFDAVLGMALGLQEQKGWRSCADRADAVEAPRPGQSCAGKPMWPRRELFAPVDRPISKGKE